jgi:hypothetical protein
LKQGEEFTLYLRNWWKDGRAYTSSVWTEIGTLEGFSKGESRANDLLRTR